MTACTLRWEDAAERVQPPEGWACVKCRRWYAEDERAARYCCHTDAPCNVEGCTGRREKPYTTCRSCRIAKDDQKWEAARKIALPDDLHAQPVCVWDDDRYFFDLDALLEYAEEHPHARFELCAKMIAPRFEASEFLCDVTPEDAEVDDSNDDAINALIREVALDRWSGCGVGIDPDSVNVALREANA